MKSLKQFLGYCNARRGNPLADEVSTIYFGNDSTNRTGHIIQCYFAAQIFLLEYPVVKADILRYPDDEAFELQNTPGLSLWLQFLNDHAGESDDDLGYSFPSIIRNLPRNLGGMVTSGGGWGYPLKLVLPLVARLI